MMADGPICARCARYGHETHDIDRCPKAEELRKPEPVPDPVFSCFHCSHEKHLDDMRWTYPGHNLCVRCLKGGTPEGWGDGATEIVP